MVSYRIPALSSLFAPSPVDIGYHIFQLWCLAIKWKHHFWIPKHHNRISCLQMWCLDQWLSGFLGPQIKSQLQSNLWWIRIPLVFFAVQKETFFRISHSCHVVLGQNPFVMLRILKINPIVMLSTLTKEGKDATSTICDACLPTEQILLSKCDEQHLYRSTLAE